MKTKGMIILRTERTEEGNVKKKLYRCKYNANIPKTHRMVTNETLQTSN